MVPSEERLENSERRGFGCRSRIGREDFVRAECGLSILVTSSQDLDELFLAQNFRNISFLEELDPKLRGWRGERSFSGGVHSSIVASHFPW